MGFGKFLLGGVCAVGAVIAAPVVVPAAGMAIAASSVTGMAGLTVGLGMATASATTVATAAGVAAGVAGIAVGDVFEEKETKQKMAGYENRIRDMNIDNATKQRIIEDLNKDIEQVKAELLQEKNKNVQNKSKIQMLQQQLDDLYNLVAQCKSA